MLQKRKYDRLLASHEVRISCLERSATKRPLIWRVGREEDLRATGFSTSATFSEEGGGRSFYATAFVYEPRAHQSVVFSFKAAGEAREDSGGWVLRVTLASKVPEVPNVAKEVTSDTPRAKGEAIGYVTFPMSDLESFFVGGPLYAELSIRRLRKPRKAFWRIRNAMKAWEGKKNVLLDFEECRDALLGGTFEATEQGVDVRAMVFGGEAGRSPPFRAFLIGGASELSAFSVDGVSRILLGDLSPLVVNGEVTVGIELLEGSNVLDAVEEAKDLRAENS